MLELSDAGFRQDMKDLKMFKDFSMDHVIDKGAFSSYIEFITKFATSISKVVCKITIVNEMNCDAFLSGVSRAEFVL